MYHDRVSADLIRLGDGSLCASHRFAERYGIGGTLADIEADTGDARTPTEKDRGKVSYSESLQRLVGVTQVLSPDPARPHMHNRAKHSQKVALVAREIAEGFVRSPLFREVIGKAGGLDVTACEVAGLAHDLGHPPFGHAAEEALDAILLRPSADDHGTRIEQVSDGFEGNAQTFRILARLDRKDDSSTMGLGLTNLTMAAIQKYPHPRLQTGERADRSDKFGAYHHSSLNGLEDGDEELRLAINTAVTQDPSGKTKSLEAQIMDIADDITYAAHDFEDFYCENLLDGYRIRSDLKDAIDGLEQASEPFGKDVGLQHVPELKPILEGLKARGPYRTNAFFKTGVKRAMDEVPGFSLYEYVGAMKALDRDLISSLTFFFARSAKDTGLFRARISRLVAPMFASLSVESELDAQGNFVAPVLTMEIGERHKIEVMKTLTRRYIISTPFVGVTELSQNRSISIVFSGLQKWIIASKDPYGLPEPLQSYLLGDWSRFVGSAIGDSRIPPVLFPAARRAIADYICSLTDYQCYQMSRWLNGVDVPTLGGSL